METTWSHLYLFAKMCAATPSGDITSDWIALLEQHHANSLPFTLWPLTYRTSVVAVSSAVESPHAFQASEDVHVQFYRSNDVLIVCTSCPDEVLYKYSSDDDYCKRMSIFNTSFGANTLRNHKSLHRTDAREVLVPCDFFQVYCDARSTIMQEIIAHIEQRDRVVKNVVCTGFRAGAIQAVYLAYDLAREFEEQRRFYADASTEFLDVQHVGLLDNIALAGGTMRTAPSTVRVDCFTFGEPRCGSRTFWGSFDAIVGSHLRVAHVRDTIVTSHFHDATTLANDVMYVDDAGPVPRTSCPSMFRASLEFFRRIFVRVVPRARFSAVDVSTYARSVEKAVRI